MSKHIAGNNKILFPKEGTLFPQIFGLEENLDVLTSLVSSVLEVSEESIKDIKIIHSEAGVIGIEAELNGKRTNIGIYVVPYGGMANRVIAHWGRDFLLSFLPRRKFFGWERATPIIFCEENYIPGEKYHHKLHLYGDEGRDDFSDAFEVHVLETQKALDLAKDEKNRIAAPVLNWIWFLFNNDEETCAILSQQSTIMRKAVELQRSYSKN